MEPLAEKVAKGAAQLAQSADSLGWLDRRFWGNSISVWLLALVVAAAVAGALWFARGVIRGRAAKAAARTANRWDDLVVAVLERTRMWFLLGAGLYAGSWFILLPEATRSAVNRGAAVLLILQSGFWLNTAIAQYFDRYRERKLKEDPAAYTTMNAVVFLVRVAMWSVIVLLVLANAGVEIAPLVAGLGVGGIAVALAVQTVLGDLLASLSIVLDKPFVVGDFLIVDEFLGSVEHIGLKTTRIRSLTGEQLVFSNADLLKSRIRNFGRMRERRVVFTVGVTYGTPKEKLEKIPGILRAAVESQPRTRFDRAHFKQFGDFSLNFETVYYMGVPDYNAYMDVQQAINLFIYEQFAKEGIEFAYPTQTIFLASGGEPARPAGSKSAH